MSRLLSPTEAITCPACHRFRRGHCAVCDGWDFVLVAEPWRFAKLTDAEIRKLALDLAEGGPWCIREEGVVSRASPELVRIVNGLLAERVGARRAAA